jgi:hypothetical protein
VSFAEVLKQMFSEAGAAGLLAGVLFGILLQRGHALRYNKILGVLRLKDFTIVKIMLTAGLIGMLLLRLLDAHGINVHPDIKTLAWGPVIVGGLVFGVGFALLGYCPGTAVGAAFEGRLDALFGGIVGMVVGGWAFAEAHAAFLKGFMEAGPVGKLTFYELFKDQFRLAENWTLAIFAGLFFLILLILQLAGPKDTPADELI